MAPSFWQIAIVEALIVLLFGRGKISSLMGDVAKGIKSFKKGLSDDPDNNKSISDNDNNNKSES
jgi:sec-independent protein translocase protein TatA